MIDYATWRHDCALEFNSEPSVLTEKQRRLFWCFASGMPRKKIYAHLGMAKGTVSWNRKQIAKKIPALTSDAAYGALATEIARRNLGKRQNVELGRTTQGDRHAHRAEATHQSLTAQSAEPANASAA